MPVLNKNSKLPTDILEKLKELDDNLEEEDITIKGYCKRKWALLQQYVSENITTNIKSIQTSIAQKNIDEKEAYSKMFELLRIENMFISEKFDDQINKKILGSTENLPKIDVTKPCSSKTDNFLKSTIITNFTKLVNNKLDTRISSSIHLNKRKNVEQTNGIPAKIKDKKTKANKVSPPTKSLEVSFPKIKLNSVRCFICNQYLDDENLLFYKGHPNGAVEEFVALTDPKLMLFTGEENEVHSFDQLPHNKITQFTVYDKKGHLCSFDSGLIEKNSLLYFSGYLKPIYDENSSSEGGIPAKDMGPINEWWTSGFDGGENALVGFSTAFGEYYLMEPSTEYKSIMKPVREKIYLSKVVIEFLLKTSWKNPTYEDLLIYLQTCDLPKQINQLTEEDLLRHSQFICEQVTSFDSAVEDDDLLIATSCMRSLVKLAGVTFLERKEMRKEEQKEVKSKNKSRRNKNFSRATTTELVRKVFESFFPEQLDKTKEQDVGIKRCGFCANCLLPDCGKCKNCKDKSRNKKNNKQTCSRRRCPNIAIENADDSETEESSDFIDSYNPLNISKKINHLVSWLSAPVIEQDGRTYYSSAKVGDQVINVGDHIMLKSDKSGLPLLVAKVIYMFEQSIGGKLFHARLFYRGVHTVLGETSDHRELFQVDECENCPLGSIIKKAEVEYENKPPNLNCNLEENEIFFCQKKYDRKRGRFEDLHDDQLNYSILAFKSCYSCKKQSETNKFQTPVVKTGVIIWRNEQFKVGTGVYLLPRTFEFKTAPVLNSTKKESDPIDEDMYPEFYRKKSDNIIGIEISEPFCIGYITDILTEPTEKELKPEEIHIRVKKLYRPENTHKGLTLSQQLDINLVYWSEEQETVSFSTVTGKCYIVYADILDIPVEKWSSEGPNRFYFLQSYNSITQEYLPVKDSGKFIGRQSKNKNSTKSKSKKTNNEDVPEKWLHLKEPLKTMDVFAGCGGLSEGLHQSGVADTRWAIEKEETAAMAFKINNPQTIVYSEDCNELLSKIIAGESATKTKQPLPPKDAVELLVGGPPCQGFSGMNRFNAGQYSLFKNSLIVSYLSYCDFYRPRFFILENVRNFVTFKKSMVLKLTLRCLLAMGYQCAFGVLQAGNYGVPQIRRRSIIFAAAPGEILPEYPEPLHVFTSKRANPLDVVIDNCRYNTGSKWLDCGAPYRTITVRDAMSDLPQIFNGCCTQDQSYDSEPLSHFQRVMRGPGDLSTLQDHICKEMAALVEARMTYIPTASGSDWRDLPNIKIQLSNGTTTNKLKYDWHDKKNGKSRTGSLRGVCPCASKKQCDPSERQHDTLIPWCLPHTANRHNHWAGLYGRVEWDGVFHTTVTNPEPMGKQGRVLHPTQHRVVSVRECARSQGFPDKYKFYGNVLDKHRQVGNAVPPPMGKAIGQEILKSVIIKF